MILLWKNWKNCQEFFLNGARITTWKLTFSYLSLSEETQKASNIDNKIVESENYQILLGILIDSDLSFEDLINNMCKKMSQKLNELAGISN